MVGYPNMGEARIRKKNAGQSALILEQSPPTIEVICVTYHQKGPLKVLVQSFLNQTASNWKLNVIHDGFDASFLEMMSGFVSNGETRINYGCTDKRFNDYGHSLRAEGLKAVEGDYVLITNGDNYYVPKFIEILSSAINQTKADVVMFDMIHSHNCPGGRQQPPYGYFKTSYRRGDIDMGAAIVRSDLARAAGFRDKSFAGDATYFEDVAQIAGENMMVAKINQVLFVHN